MKKMFILSDSKSKLEYIKLSAPSIYENILSKLEIDDDEYDFKSRMLIEKTVFEAFELSGYISEKEKEILKYRFGFYDCKEYTLEEVGQMFGVTRERIRQIESKAIQKLKKPARSKNLKGFY